MNRFAALLLAFVFAGVTVSSACSAAAPEETHFTLRPERSGDLIQASFSRDHGSRDVNNWSSSFSASQLTGLDLAAFRGAGNRPLRFAIVREAGRLDCAGTGGHSRADGNRRFTPDPGFRQLLESRGIGRPTTEDSFGMMALDVRRSLIDALAAARYPTPTIGQLTSLTAIGVTSDYIRGLAAVGYRPSKLEALVEFKALGINPDYVGDFIRAGYTLTPSELVQLKALGVTADYASGFQRAGYGLLPARSLVELKALGITPDFARSVRGSGAAAPSVRQLVDLHLFGKSGRPR